MAIRVDLDRVFSEFHDFRFTVGKAIGSVDDLSVREQLEKMAQSLDEDFAQLEADAPHAWTRQTHGQHSCQSRLTQQRVAADRFGEHQELNYQQGIPPICEVREDWNAGW